MIFSSRVLVVLLFAVVFSCSQQKQSLEEINSGYPIASVDIRNVRLTDKFWLPVIERVQEKTIAYALQKCQEEGRFDNFLIAGGQMGGEAKGVMPFDDTDVYKILEGASNTLISVPNPQLESLLDSLISIIAIGQEEDGYLTTWRTINPKKPTATWVAVKQGKRWESLNMSHELYNAGHLYEAAVVHYQATGKRNFLDIAIKNADLIVKVFGVEPNQIAAVPGHQIIETGLLKLYQVTGNESYLKQAKYFLDHRGGNGFGPYAQDHKPVIEQDEVVGHAVRAVYMYAAMTDIAALQKDSAYSEAVFNLWENMVGKKIYLTGGIGARHHGESFGENYELPNLTAYNETCAAIGSVYWNHRLFNLTGEARFQDLIERTLYNAVLPGISLDGTHFFYPNALEADGKYEFNRGSCTRQSWFDCSCCPTNLIRFLPSLSGLIYSRQSDTIYVNQLIANEAEIMVLGASLKLEMESNLPWSGEVKLKIASKTEEPVSIKIRIPSWARNQVIPNGPYTYQPMLDDYAVISTNWGNDEVLSADQNFVEFRRKWNAGDEIEIALPMHVRHVQADKRIKDDSGKVALEYGPLVYAFEEVDNPNYFENIKEEPSYAVSYDLGLLGGVNTLQSESGTMAIPYYSWSNRGIGKMKVWIEKD